MLTTLIQHFKIIPTECTGDIDIFLKKTATVYLYRENQ